MNLQSKLPEDFWEYIRENYEKRKYTSAISDAFHFLTELIRNKAGIDGDGSSLIGQAFGGTNPKIKINSLQSESEKSVQKGIESILRGLYLSIRNPRSHNRITDSESDAQSVLLFIGYIIRQLDVAKTQFSQQEFIKRITDPDFVANGRYSKLLVSKIPAKKRLDVFIDIFRIKTEIKPEKLAFFFAELLSTLSESELTTVYTIISDELEITDDEATIRCTIGAFSGDIWPNISEISRLRIEHRLVKSIIEGRYDKYGKKCRSGILGTWATRLYPHFSSKSKTLNAIIDKLETENTEQDLYVFNYHFHYLDALSPKITSRLSKALVAGLKKGKIAYYDALNVPFPPWPSTDWPDTLREAFNNFQEDVEDDVPF